MAAERSLESPFKQEAVYQDPDVHLEINPESVQRTEIYRGRARMGRFGSTDYTLEMPLDHVSSNVFDVHLNGLSAAKPSYRHVRAAGAQLGKSGISLGARQGFPILDALSPRGTLDTERYREQAAWEVSQGSLVLFRQSSCGSSAAKAGMKCFYLKYFSERL